MRLLVALVYVALITLVVWFVELTLPMFPLWARILTDMVVGCALSLIATTLLVSWFYRD